MPNADVARTEPPVSCSIGSIDVSRVAVFECVCVCVCVSVVGLSQPVWVRVGLKMLPPLGVLLFFHGLLPR